MIRTLLRKIPLHRVAVSPKLFPPACAPSPVFSAPFIHTVRQRLDEVVAVPDASTLVSEKKTQALCGYYQSLIPSDRSAFLQTLAKDYGVDSNMVQQCARGLTAAQERGSGPLMRAEERLRHVLVPKYQHLFTQISKLERGVKFLVDLRADAISEFQMGTGDASSLQAISQCLRDLMSLWFSVGFLTLERITWESPCDMLQKISEYEAVHPIRNWTDLKRRVGHNRRCFVFTHHSMPREPVVVLHTALTNEISHSIQNIVNSASETNQDADNPSNNNTDFSTAIFYSITSTQKGLQGVELGNYLIKHVVRELLLEFPRMSQFSSLSPIPGFKDWLIGQINKYLHQEGAGEFPEQVLFTKSELKQMGRYFPSEKHALEGFKKSLATNAWFRDERLVETVRIPLVRLCARYLYQEKRRGYALNPVELETTKLISGGDSSVRGDGGGRGCEVRADSTFTIPEHKACKNCWHSKANFHLRNGAVMWRINWLADTSPRGLGASCGLMVNYRYFLDKTEDNSKVYMEQHYITASDSVLEIVQQQDSMPSSTTGERSMDS